MNKRSAVRTRRILALKLLAVCLLGCVWVAAAEYDPLTLSESSEANPIELTVKDKEREREVPLKVYLPVARTPAPVVLFSHGLGGTRQGSAFLGKHWAARGYVAVFLQHPGSDDSVWKNRPREDRLAALQEAASPQNYLLRVQDVPAVLDQLTKWNHERGFSLAGRLNVERVGMSGHSFGALTTQAVAGQSAAAGGQRFADPRITAAILLSPSSPRRGDLKAAFGSVKIPWLLMTGTRDTSPIGGQTVESRLAVFPALPEGDKYELVLHNAEHSAFTDRALPGDTEKRNPNHHRVILALSTAFWDAYLRDDRAAKAWLEGAGPRGVLEAEDKWQKK